MGSAVWICPFWRLYSELPRYAQPERLGSLGVAVVEIIFNKRFGEHLGRFNATKRLSPCQTSVFMPAMCLPHMSVQNLNDCKNSKPMIRQETAGMRKAQVKGRLMSISSEIGWYNWTWGYLRPIAYCSVIIGVNGDVTAGDCTETTQRLLSWGACPNEQYLCRSKTITVERERATLPIKMNNKNILTIT